MLKLSAIVAVILAGGVIFHLRSLGAGEPAKHPSLDTPEVKVAVTFLKAARNGSDSESTAKASADAAEALGQDHFARRMLLDFQKIEPTATEERREALDRVIESLTFRPWMESGLPEGFPSFTPVHHIEVKTLPKYRMAQALMPAAQNGNQNGAFWKLFGHIKRNDIAMTAPVRMDYTGNNEGAEVASMAFLYGSLKIGDPGDDAADNSVEVIDIPQQEVVSIGIRGRMSEQSVNAGHRRLLAWLDAHRHKFRASGPLRRMGYNSPFIPADRSFFELQIPIERLPAESVPDPEEEAVKLTD